MFVNAINYLYHLIMGRLMGPAEYGILASLYSILYIISIIPMSTSFAIVKFVSVAKGSKEVVAVYSTLKSFVFKLAIIGMVLIIVTSPYIAGFLQIDNSLGVLIIGPILFFSLICLVNQATSQGLLKFSGNVVPNIISGIAKLLFGVSLVIYGLRSFGAMVGVLIAIILAYLYSYFYLVKKIKIGDGGKDKFDLKKFFSFAFPVLIQALAFTSFFTTDLILVKHFFPPFEAGIYAALSMLGKIIYFAVSPITATMFPIVSGKKSRGEKFYKDVLISFLLTFVGAGLVVGFYKLFPNLAIEYLYGEKYMAAKGELFIMGLFILFYTLSYFLVNLFLSLGKTSVSYLPLAISFLQIIGIWFYHNSLKQVIVISLTLSVLLFLTLFLYLGYNQSWRIKSFFRS